MRNKFLKLYFQFLNIHCLIIIKKSLVLTLKKKMIKEFYYLVKNFIKIL